ncbi:MAG TPA: nitroreductase family protein [Acidimicrobiales bacterium]|nr:nitroreductase family protein [Acidimicrobiales bacterium]
MELTEAIGRRRMTRNFSGRPLPDGLVDGMLADALRAPSAGNTQGLELVVLEGPAQTHRYWQATTDEAWRRDSRRYEGLRRAPVVILAYADPDRYVDRYREPDKSPVDGTDVTWVVPFWFVDVAFATMTLLLRAAEEQIGAAFLGNFRGDEELSAVLGVPPRLAWMGAVLLGEAAEPDPPSSSLKRGRRPFEEAVHRGGW